MNKKDLKNMTLEQLNAKLDQIPDLGNSNLSISMDYKKKCRVTWRVLNLMPLLSAKRADGKDKDCSQGNSLYCLVRNGNAITQLLLNDNIKPLAEILNQNPDLRDDLINSLKPKKIVHQERKLK